MRLRHIPRETSRFIRRSVGIPPRQKEYWESRQSARYILEVNRLVNEVARDAESILDVGSNGCGYLDWFRWAPLRVSLDIEKPYVADGVTSVRADFLAHQFPEPFDLVLCLQVLEHIPDATAFAQKLLGSARHHVIVSVPYRWPIGKCAEHVHDPVDEAKVRSWFGREPDASRIIRDGGWHGTARLICRYDLR